MYGGRGRRLFVAYVGIGDNLRRRVVQHLVKRDSSVATGTSAVGLNPDYVTQVRWWVSPDFDDRHVLEAAELVAFDVLDPALRSRGTISGQTSRFYKDAAFQQRMRSILLGAPAGHLRLPTLHDAMERIEKLEQRLAELEGR